MPKATTVQKRDVGIDVAFGADSQVKNKPAPERTVEAKTATMTQKIQPSLRTHFQIAAKREGRSLTSVIVECLKERYPLPDGLKYEDDGER